MKIFKILFTTAFFAFISLSCLNAQNLNNEASVSGKKSTAQEHIAKGAAEMKAKNVEGAIAEYRKALEQDKNNSAIYLRIAMAQRTIDEDGAIATFEQITTMEGAKPGDVATAKKQVAAVYLKRAAAAQSKRDWNVMYENAQKAIGYDSANMQGFRLLTVSTIELKKWEETIEACEAVLNKEPAVRDKNAIIYRLATAYENLKDNAKACSYYRQLAGDTNLKSSVERKIQTLCQ